MSNSNQRRIPILPLIIAAAALCLLTVLLFPIFKSVVTRTSESNALQEATHTFYLVTADQNDGTLSDGTVIDVANKTFVYTDKRLKLVQDSPDTSAVVTAARTAQNSAVVYLLAADGKASAYTPSAGITYEKIIDPDDPSIETYTYSQVNPAVQKYLDEVSYENADDAVSKVAGYVDASVRNDRPVGCTVELQAGELTIFDNGSECGYTVSVEKGPYTFYNITPGIGGEFYVKSGDDIVQRGHLRPTGTLRMIYSDNEGLENMRDLGGLPCDGGTIKYNVLFRGGKVIDATDQDRNTWVKLLGIDHDLFLKTYSENQLKEREEYRTKSPLGDHVELYQMDLSAEGSENKRNYSHAKEQINGIFNRLIDNAVNGETTYFHCLAGADRTGMVAILAEGILGVPKSEIDRDYELTSFKSLRERNGVLYTSDINILNSYPGASFRDKCIQYLLDCGISLDKINAFRKAVIDGDPEIIVENTLPTEPDGTNFSIPDGDGWIDGGRCSSTGSDRRDTPSYTLTNYISVQSGDIVYVKNLHLSDTLYSGIYLTDRTAITGFVLSPSDESNVVTDIDLTGPWETFTVNHPSAGYIRLCGTLTSDASDVIICIKRNDEWQ